MTDQELLVKVKEALGITGDFQDNLLLSYIKEVKEFLLDGGVPKDIVNSEHAIGIIVRGTADLWNYGSGGTTLSDYFKMRAIQLASISETSAGRDIIAELFAGVDLNGTILRFKNIDDEIIDSVELLNEGHKILCSNGIEQPTVQYLQFKNATVETFLSEDKTIISPTKGNDGKDGKDGYTPIKGVDYFDGKDGADGRDGSDGAPGYTPIKGVDYFDGKDGKNFDPADVTRINNLETEMSLLPSKYAAINHIHEKLAVPQASPGEETTLMGYIDKNCTRHSSVYFFIASKSMFSDLPDNQNWGFVEVYTHTTLSYKSVFFKPYVPSVGEFQYVRNLVNGTWRSWYKFTGTAVT